MPPRYMYWTIIAGGQPTAFRAATREELLPTLKQLQSRQPDAAMMWFARGKLWPTKEAAEFALKQARQRPAERRGHDWRPGGEHKDPRDRFKIPRDEKRRRFKERLQRDRLDEQRPERSFRPREGDRKQERPFRPREERPFRPKGDRPAGDRPFRPKDGGQFKPRGEGNIRGGGGRKSGGPASPKPRRGGGRGPR